MIKYRQDPFQMMWGIKITAGRSGVIHEIAQRLSALAAYSKWLEGQGAARNVHSHCLN
jgi:hypothetical protein